ncbi:MAG: hemerythrin domain-containing protein [Actinobacteria bacterium]|nr:hemerythrin domain-containing protein [Actinomycetota bacterium]
MTTDATELTGTQLLRERHQEIKRLFKETLEATGQERAEVFDCLRATLAAHEVVEEMFVHPLAKDLGPDGERIAQARLDEEAEATRVLSDLEDLGSDGDQFGPRLLAFQRAVVEHAEAEENELFPLLETSCSRADLEALADSIIVGEQLSPTHAHPHSSQNAVALMLTGPFVAMVDKARDHFKQLRAD